MLESAGHSPGTARETFEVAFQTGFLREAFARELVERIRDRYTPLFRELGEKPPR